MKKKTKLPTHKLLQEIYYHTNNNFDDDLNQPSNIPIINADITEEELIAEVKLYFLEDPGHLVYPTKSYAVGLIYATLLEHYFGVHWYNSLQDPELLYFDDPFWKGAHLTKSNSALYHAIVADDTISSMLTNCVIPDLPHIRTTVEYFMKEFLIEEPIYKQLVG